MADTKVDELYKNFQEVIKFLNENSQPSLSTYADDTFRKVIVIAAASHFEEEIKDIILKFIEKESNKNIYLMSFVKNKAIEKKFHTYFSWERSNCNNFFGLFGEEFKDMASKKVDENSTLKEATKSFMEIGRTRNIILHQNFATISLESTAKEYYELYKKSFPFIEFLKENLK